MLAGVFLVLAPMAVYARLGTVILLILTLAAQPRFADIAAALRDAGRTLFVRLSLVLFAWAALSLLWAPAPDVVLLLRVAAMPLMGLLLIALVSALPAADAERLAGIVLIGGVVMLMLLGVEVAGGGALLAIGQPDLGPLPPGQTHPVVEMSARGTAILAPLTFVYALLAYARTGRALAAFGFVAAAFAICLASSMDAAWCAILAGAVVFGFARMAPRATLIAVFGALIAYAVLAPVISASLLTHEAVLNMAVQPWAGVESRVGIWQKAATLIAERPILGHGFDAARRLADPTVLIPGTPWPALALHPHNALLQIWLELGAVGIGITIALLAAGARALWPMTARPLHLAVTLATIAGTAFMALVSFGIWQHWWLATWMLVAAALCLGLRASAPPRT